MDPKANAVTGLKRACQIFLQDLEALPGDAFAQSFSEKARTVADIVYEVNLVNDHIGAVLRSEKPFDFPEGWIKAPVEFQTKEAVIESFQTSSEKLIQTFEAFPDDSMEVTVQTERGESTRFQRAQFATLHLWYHSGQLNFIQTLRGDDGWHWG